MKVPTACFEVEGIHEIIKNGDSGFIVPQYDVEALTDKIASLLSNDDLRADFGKNAQEHAMARWDYNVMNEQLKELYLSSVS
jgi:colanic acid/amylovoran biosynthesis glycosyltransferase